jgi:molybdopterin-guanine dinucleotide biosynthesis protein A
MENTHQLTIPGVILAGGLARRMGGGDKCLVRVAGRPILTHIIESVQPQVSALALNANGDPSRFVGFALPVIPDESKDFAGPLAGILAALEWAAGKAEPIHHVLTVPGDTPFLPRDLVVRLVAGLAKGAELSLASSGGRRHPVIALWPVASRADLRRAIRSEGLRKVEAWVSRFVTTAVEFDSCGGDPFLNINTPDELAEAEQRLLTR